MNILFVTAVLPYPLHSGGQIRIYNLLKRLSKKHKITLVSFIRNQQEQEYKKNLDFCTAVQMVVRGRAMQPSYIIKSIFPTPRPFMVNGDLASVIIPPMDGAFPSGHSATAFALAVTIFLHDRKIGTLFLICAILIGIGRVYANVHYPVDILGGALIGTLVAIIIENVHFKKFVS